jgi:hypothetical protein
MKANSVPTQGQPRTWRPIEGTSVKSCEPPSRSGFMSWKTLMAATGGTLYRTDDCRKGRSGALSANEQVP